MSKNKWLARSYAFVTVLIWSTVYISTRHLLKNYTSMEIGGLRYSIAAVVLLFVSFLKREKHPKKKDLMLFFAGGFFGFGFYIIAFNIAAGLLPSGVCSFVVTTSSIFTTLLSSFFLREKLKVKEAVSLIIQLAGVGVLTLTAGEISFNKGIVVMLSAALSLGVYNLIQRKLVARGYSAMQITTYCILCGIIWLVLGFVNALTKIRTVTLADIGSALYLGVIASAAAYYFWAKAMCLTDKTGNVSNFMFLIPFLTSIIGRIVFQEVPDVHMYIGGGLLTVGFLIYMYGGKAGKMEKEG